MTIQNLYTQYLEGKITQQKFLYEARRDQNLTMISSTNSFDDVVKILKNKSIISEKAYKESTGKQEVEVIAKTIDMVNPYEYTRGMNYELDLTYTPAGEANFKPEDIAKAQKKVLTNLTKNPQYYCDKMHGKGEVSEDWVEVTKKEMDKIGKGKSKIIREGYSAVLDLPNGNYFAIDDNWEDEYQGKNGLFFTIKGNNLYDIDGELIQSSPREFLSQFKPEEILKVEAMKEGIDNKLKQMGYSNSDIEDFMDEWEQGGSKLPKKVKDYLDNLYQAKENENLTEYGEDEFNRSPEMYSGGKSTREVGGDFEGAGLIVVGRTQIDNNQIADMLDETDYHGVWNTREGYWFFPEDESTFSYLEADLDEEFAKRGINARFEGQFNENLNEEESTPISKKEILQALIPLAANKGEIKQYMQSLSKSGDTFDNVDDYAEDFKNYIADKSLEEHGEYFDRVSDVNIDQSPLEEKRLRIYEKYAQKFNKTIDEVKCMVDEAIALKDKAGNIQYAKDSTEASNIEKNAKAKGVTLTKTQA
jgi:hypothetical protein